MLHHLKARENTGESATMAAVTEARALNRIHLPMVLFLAQLLPTSRRLDDQGAKSAATLPGILAVSNHLHPPAGAPVNNSARPVLLRV